ncbi:neuromedin-U receptor 2 [Biomphalaria glabrata]|nr:neuromedin-U receptor 2-like [Biomphalaria glabrata]
MELTNERSNEVLQLNETIFKINCWIDLQNDCEPGAELARWVINYIVTPILCILGVVGNYMNIIVLRRCGYKDTNVLLLVSLSLADLLLSLINGVLHIHFIIESFDFVAASLIGSYAQQYLLSTFTSSLCIVQCHLVSIATERFIAVYFPFHVARIFSRSRVLIIIFCMYIFSIIFYIPHGLIYDVATTNIPGTNRTMYIRVVSQYFLANYDAMYKYSVLGTGNLTTGILPAFIVIESALVGMKLIIRKSQPLSKMKKGDANDLKGMRLLMAVCVVSVLVSISGLTIVHFHNDRRPVYSSVLALKIDISNSISQFFSSTNFVIYVTMSNKFYRT